MRMRKLLAFITYVGVQTQLNLKEPFRQFFKGNNMGLLKIHNGGNYAHAQDANAYNLCWSSIQQNL